MILFPADQVLWMPQSRRIKCVRPSADGAFAFIDLPPGTYQLAAVDDVEPGEWYDPVFLQQLVAASMMLTVGEGEKRTQDVRVSR